MQFLGRWTCRVRYRHHEPKTLLRAVDVRTACGALGFDSAVKVRPRSDCHLWGDDVPLDGPGLPDLDPAAGCHVTGNGPL